MAPSFTIISRLLPVIGLAPLLCAEGEPAALPAESADTSAATPEKAVNPAEAALLKLCGQEISEAAAATAEEVERLLKEGAEPDCRDAEGNTPLLLLCRQAALSPAPSAAGRAITPAAALLLEKGADAYNKNDRGCDAMMYLQSLPESVDTLTRRNLLHGEGLAVRIPPSSKAFFDYMTRYCGVANERGVSLPYLNKLYLAPAYERAEELLSRLMEDDNRETVRLLGLSSAAGNAAEWAMFTTLDFMRKANARKAEAYVDKLSLWKNSEHFLEETPLLFLHCLHGLHWQISPANLSAALNKLEKMLPENELDMIDCTAGSIMALLLDLEFCNAAVSRSKALQRAARYAKAYDPALAASALAKQLEDKKLPTPQQLADLTPEPTGLPGAFANLFRVDAYLSTREGTTPPRPEPTVEQMSRAAETLRLLKLPRHARAVEQQLNPEETESDPTLHPAAFTTYPELPGTSPLVAMCRYILRHPETFRRP